ncbi:helix-turn-helix domain-containing protein [Spiroplasma endosymbiont of Nephrotoma flavescens]|uniref:helix-turn-helix domain-containing protein n=1 Tax=Spiroplasma endosymbiont of Nephrotoma flavescens TaxID=3066302 RepID=UPI00313A9C0A
MNIAIGLIFIIISIMLLAYFAYKIYAKIKISEIAKNLNRSISTINREVNRNKDNNHYFSLIAQNKAENRK